MNVYLIGVGSQLSKIRELLDWTQENLSDEIGVSRPVISNIEKDPTKMTKTILLALYVACFGEIKKRKVAIESLDYSLWENVDTRAKLIGDIKATGFNKKALSSTILGIGLFAAAAVIPFAGLAVSANIATAALHYFSKPEEAKKDKKIKKEDIKKLVLGSLEKTELELCNFFGLDRPNMLKFLNNIEQGAPKESSSTQ